jgi:transcriptional regulator GlxA family with amidase domain
MDAAPDAVEVIIVAVPETAGSALYGMLDVLMATGNIWQTLVGTRQAVRRFRVRILSPRTKPFTCGHGIPVRPDLSIAEDPEAGIVILPELWLGPSEHLHGRYPELMDWIRRRYASGATIYSACSGSVMLAETGLLDDREATSHWGYQELFRDCYPRVRFCASPNLVFAVPDGRIVTAGGTTSWHDLAIHIIARHASPGEALRIAKVYLLKWHAEGQLPFETLTRHADHDDAAVRACEAWLGQHFRRKDALARVVRHSGIPERTLKRRFKRATGTTLIDCLQNLRIEEAKRLLETTTLPGDEVSAEAGYEDPSFFRRLFKRRTGLTPGQYRRLFRPIATAGRA